MQRMLEVDAARPDGIMLVIAADTLVSTEVFVAALGYAKPLIVLGNKIDTVDWAEAQLRTTVAALDIHVSKDKTNGSSVIVIPIAALQGDNLVEPSRKSLWFEGVDLGVGGADKTATTLMDALEAALAA
ncbi:MAG: hypothetical protein M1825_004403 [Sarcosagium campestre]|nr:MAG: hypothetical protein M1825_004403 [Sarcosagium campestre]